MDKEKHKTKKEAVYRQAEEIIRKIIPYALIGLLFVIIVELFFKEFAEHYHTQLLVLDSIIIAIFVVDLFFLWQKSKTVSYFFKKYWLDILAVFPFTLFFNAINRLANIIRVGKEISIGQAIAHETLEARKGFTAIARTEKLTKFGRAGRFIRIGARTIRLLSKSRPMAFFKRFRKKNNKTTK